MMSTWRPCWIRAFCALALALHVRAVAQEAHRDNTRPENDPRRTPVVAAVEKIGPAVVNISAERLVRRRPDFFEQFFDFGLERRDRGYTTDSLGSGVIVDPTGTVVTNDHVISGASRIFVTLSDGRELQAEVLGADADSDLAVLKVESKSPLKAVRLGTTSDILIGETAVAVGNPFGFTNTVTVGIVSAVHRTVKGEAGRTYSDFIQTDAAINPGNSGGALANILGELLGINTAIVGGANNIGFAIPIERVRRVTDDLLRFGEVKPVWLGLRGTTLSAERSRASSKGLGLRIQSVYPDSPAARAGLLVGDVVVAMNGKPVESREDFDTALASTGSGQTLSLDVRRRGAERTVTLTTARAPEDLGLTVLRREIGLTLSQGRSGLVVSGVARDSLADRKGLARGDRVIAVNGRKTATVDDLGRAVEAGLSRSSLVLVVVRGGYAYTLTFALE